MANALVVSDIAEMIAPVSRGFDDAWARDQDPDYAPDPAARELDRQRLMRQLRHWTLAGALRPTGGVYIGTGRSREYAIETVLVAAILVELSKLSMTIGTLKSAADMLYEAIFTGDAAQPEHWRKELAEKRLFLRLQFGAHPADADPICTLSVVLDPSWFAANEKPVGSSAVIVDLRYVFGLLKI